LVNLKLNKTYNMDCVTGLKLVDDEIIDLTVTSPPYDNLRDYHNLFDFESLAKELFRVTKKGGVVVWVVNDATIKGNRTLTSFRQAIYFQDIGFFVHDVMVYKKPNISLPGGSNRYHPQFEFMFVLSKGTPKTFNSIKDRKNVTAGSEETSYQTGKKRITQDFGKRTNIWEYNVGGFSSAEDKYARLHPAIFPEQLVEDHIKSWSNKGDLVLDPFMGSGTTSVVAKYLERAFIGFEISEEYCKIANERLKVRPQIGNWL